MNEQLKIALPSKGSLGETSIRFLENCGIKVKRRNDRQYTGTIKDYPIDVLFQRAEDIVQKVREGTCHLGITGLDIVEEHKKPGDSLQIVYPDLEYGAASLVVAVPESWIHVTSIYDLADVAAKWRLNDEIRNLRIATKFKNLTEKFLHENNIYNYSLVDVSGVLEVAPQLKVADVIVDLTSTGVTLRENHLKVIDGGVILDSQACLIANPSLFEEKNTSYHSVLEQVLDMIESRLRAGDYVRVMTSIEWSDPESIEAEILKELNKMGVGVETFNLTESLARSKEKRHIMNLNIVVAFRDLYKVVRTLRQFNAVEIASSRIDYLFLRRSEYYERGKKEYQLSLNREVEGNIIR